MNAIPTNRSCERCGREASAISSCLERPSGSCPFVEQWRRRIQETLVVGGFLTFVLACVTGTLKSGWWVFIGLATIGIWAISQEVQLYNSKSHTRLQRTTLAGVELSHRWTSKGRLLPLHLEPRQPLAYPLSITALAALSQDFRKVRVSQAVTIFRAALIDLLLKERIEVYLSQSYVFRKWQRSPSVVNNYGIVAAQNTDQAQSAGVLESGIIEAVAAWPSKPRAEEWTDGPPISDLVCAVYESDSSGVATWLVERVAHDAAARGLGRLRGKLFWKRTEWDAAHASCLRKEHQITQALSERLAQTYPEFSRTLDRQILKAIISREPSGD